MQYTRNQIREAYKKLPKEMQEMYSSHDIDDKIFEIGKKHNLHIDKLGELASQVGYVMLGLTSASEFMPHLEESLGVEKNVVQAIAQDINKEIFADIRDLMQNEKREIINEIEKEDEVPGIMRGMHDPFEEKMKPEGHVSPKHPAGNTYRDIHDPYREPID